MAWDELIERGWNLHAEQAGNVAAELEHNAALADDAARATAFLRLANHTIGGHLHDWPRARALAVKVIGTLPASADAADPLSALAVVEFMADDWKSGLSTLARVIALDPENAGAIVARIDADIAQNLVGSGALEAGAHLYEATLDLARGRSNAASDRAVAVASNNLANELLAKDVRTRRESDVMRTAALAAREFWRKCGTWVNEERAEYLLALVANAVGDPATAREHGARALELISANGEENVDEAFIHLALAHACRLAAERTLHDDHLQRAERVAESFDTDGLRNWFAAERAKAIWT